MAPIDNILIGLQIGFQLFASYYCLKIMSIKFVPTSPYLILFIAFMIRTAIVANEWLQFMSPFIKNFSRMSVSLLTMIAVVQIYYLIKKKLQ